MSSRRPLRIVLIALLVLAVIVLAGVLAVLLPILTHQSAGGSGQRVPQDFAAESSAEGADGRTRTLSVETADGQPAELDALNPGERLVVRGEGFDSGIGIYLAICGIPASPEEKPGPCLGGIPEGAMTGEADESLLASAWITNDWAWRNFATHGFGENGSFEVELTVPEASGDGIDCRVDRCAIATRADHTASGDRVQDMLLPVAFRD
ncbi:hypothetical protein [Leucobacter massiliensis]|uniref:Uncharacterized protein n=1 Tax=Leucobacter massiliensis TaxID=1686285 RepID=A0A2S9QPW9_9MICO|nr:hypothetical protein [Leucobacter massiliensis]PRI11634.1 hypothetical protein B4915_05885 [Leucobacter massiliensis]